MSVFGNEWETLISEVQGFFAFLSKNLALEQPKTLNFGFVAVFFGCSADIK